MAHIDAGKTTLTERILYYTGINHKIGDTHDGTATMDWMEQEQERGITITSTTQQHAIGHWNRHKKNQKVHLSTVSILLIHQVTLTLLLKLSVHFVYSDGAVGVFCAKGGVEPQSETVWRQADKYKVPYGIHQQDGYWVQISTVQFQ